MTISKLNKRQVELLKLYAINKRNDREENYEEAIVIEDKESEGDFTFYVSKLIELKTWGQGDIRALSIGDEIAFFYKDIDGDNWSNYEYKHYHSASLSEILKEAVTLKLESDEVKIKHLKLQLDASNRIISSLKKEVKLTDKKYRENLYELAHLNLEFLEAKELNTRLKNERFHIPLLSVLKGFFKRRKATYQNL
ncbi:hypothetical protein HRF87_05710 [Bacillus sp. CRN 9]|nr:hypothetical protein [Bacillus sp. CRN 9]